MARNFLHAGRRLGANGLRHRALVFVLVFVIPAGAQSRSALLHQSWSTDAGLPQSSVHQILQSRDGYLWLATEGGVVRYDGVVFTVFNHDTDAAFTSNDITSLAQDGAGNLWFGTADGLIEIRHGGDPYHARRFTEADGLPSAAVLSLSAAGGDALLVLTSAGPASVVSEHVSVAAGSAAANDSSQGGRVAVRDGAWTWGDRWVKYEASGKQREWRTGEELPGSRVQAVYVDRSGLGWVGTNRGLVTVQRDAAPVAVASLGVNSVLSLLEDREGNMWVGTETSGLHALRPRKFRSLAALADDEVSCVMQSSDGAVWVGTKEDGVRRILPESAAAGRPVANASLTSPVILSLAPGVHGDMWAGTPDGLNHIAADGAVERFTSSDGLPDDLVQSLAAAPDGSLWAGTRRGLIHLHDGRMETMTQANGLGNDLAGSLYQSFGGSRDLWVGTLAGLSRLHAGLFRNYGRAEGFGSNLVSGVAEDKAGRLWAATRDAGLFLLTGDRFVPVRPEGLPVELLGMLADQEGFLWLRTRHGVVRAGAAGLAQCMEGRACPPVPSAYGVDDGMPSEEAVANGSPTGWRMADGELWFPTRKGVAIADPATLPLNAVPPPVIVERFQADNETFPVSAEELLVPSGHGRYTFDFAALSFTVPSKVLYRYKLEGFDMEWSVVSARRNASYTNLPPGHYTFRVQAANNDGVWNEAGAALRFRILPPLWRRWWFLLGALMLLGGVVLGLYRLRVRRLQQSFNAVLGERNRIAREIHDTLAQDMVGISLQLDMVTRLLKSRDLDGAAQQVTNTRGFVQTGIEEARQSIWNLRANTAQNSLPSRVKAACERVAGASGLVVRTKMGGAYRALAPELEAEVERILQETLSNVERHAQATVASVQLTYGQDKLMLMVTDNGRGFDPAEAAGRAGHFGLQGIRERAAAIGATLRLTSSAGDGTTMELAVPLKIPRGQR